MKAATPSYTNLIYNLSLSCIFKKETIFVLQVNRGLEIKGRYRSLSLMEYSFSPLSKQVNQKARKAYR